jgi:periplasmic divalent cation tolerance protein
MKPLFFCYTCFENHETAEKIVTLLLEKKLIVCANLFPVTSFYTWNGKICKEPECSAILKTTDKELLLKTLEKQHPYETPVIAFFPVDANASYLEWAHNVGLPNT